MSFVHVHLLPALAQPEELRGGTVVVIDALRATTTITAALAAGAARVIPCGEVAEAEKIARELPPGTAILGGERHGLRIPGFTCGNSPSEYTPAVVGGKTLVFTTTNGTRALAHARQASRVLIGAAVNVSAVARAVSGAVEVHLLCAGTDGRLTAEDVLVAGLIVRCLIGEKTPPALNDGAQLALLAAADVTSSAELTQLFRTSRGGRNLGDIGLESDIPWCATVDRFALAPELDLRTGDIR